MHLNLSADDVLATTRAVRKRLDFDRPVPDQLIRECVAMAQQSPSGSNNPSMSFMIVKDAKKRKAVGEVYNRCFEQYKTWDGRYIGSIQKATPEENAQQQRSAQAGDGFYGPLEHAAHARQNSVIRRRRRCRCGGFPRTQPRPCRRCAVFPRRS